MRAYRIKVIESLKDLQPFSSLWNELLLKSRSDSIFLTWEWISCWTEHFLDISRKLFVIAIFEDNKLVGLAPWYIRSRTFLGFPLRCVEFIGSPETGSDYLDVFTTEGREIVVADVIYEFLMNEVKKEWDVLLLRDFRASSFFLCRLLVRIEQDGKYAESEQGSLCPIIRLPVDKDFSSILTSHRRAKLKREIRVLERQGVVKHDSLDISEAPEAIVPFLTFYERKKEYKDPQLLVFLKAFANRSAETRWITVDTLTVDGQCIASLLHFTYGNKWLQYLMVTDKEFNPKVSLGDMIIGLVLEKAIAQGVGVYDFLKGPEDHKFRWANSANSSTNLLLGQKKVLSVAFMLGQLTRNAAKIIAR